jgi:hypothetical protein
MGIFPVPVTSSIRNSSVLLSLADVAFKVWEVHYFALSVREAQVVRAITMFGFVPPFH